MSAPSHSNMKKAIGLFGRNGSGKSSLTKQIIRSYVRRGGQVIALDRQNQFAPYSRWPPGGLTMLDSYLESEIKNRHHGLLVLDDADVFMVSRSGQVWRDLIASHRHYNLDLLVSARQPQNIDTTLLGCLHRVCIFWTSSPLAMKHYERLLAEFPGALDKIPKVPFRYLEVNFETGQMAIHDTVKM